MVVQIVKSIMVISALVQTIQFAFVSPLVSEGQSIARPTPLAALLRPQAAHEVVALRLYARGGSTTIGPAQAGADLLHARSARHGTEHFPKSILNAELASMGTEVGCRADEDLTVFYGVRWLNCLTAFFHPSGFTCVSSYGAGFERPDSP